MIRPIEPPISASASWMPCSSGSFRRSSTQSGGVEEKDRVVMAASSVTLSGEGKAGLTSTVAPRLRCTVETGPLMSTLTWKRLTWRCEATLSVMIEWVLQMSTAARLVMFLLPL